MSDWKRFKKRPVEIYARRNDGPELVIHTLEGDMLCRTGDWIVKGIKGEEYPVREDIFKETYEEMTPFDPHKTPVGMRLDAGLVD